MLRTTNKLLKISVTIVKRNYGASLVSCDKYLEVVPALGESITEGTIAKWNKEVGDKVNVEDVLAVIETDKVTVDIKATQSGILTKKMATELVVVGKPLCEIETSGAVATPVLSNSATKATGDDVVQAVSKSNGNNHSRTPLIKFIGKREHKKETHQPTPVVSSTPTYVVTQPTDEFRPSKPQTGVDFFVLKDKAFFGRPKLSQKEIDAIEMGGAM